MKWLLSISLFLCLPGFGQRTRDCNGPLKPDAGFTFANTDCSIYDLRWQGTDTTQIKSFHWNFGDGTSAGRWHTEHVYANGQYKVQLIVVAANGCRDTASMDITVNKPKADFNYQISATEPGKVSFIPK